MPISTQKAPSARTVEEFGQSLGSLHVSHPPVLYIQVLAVRRLLHTRPPGVPRVCEVLRSDAYRHSEITHWANYRGTLVSCSQVRMSCICLRFTFKCWKCGVFCTHGPQI